MFRTLTSSPGDTSCGSRPRRPPEYSTRRAAIDVDGRRSGDRSADGGEGLRGPSRTQSRICWTREVWEIGHPDCQGTSRRARGRCPCRRCIRPGSSRCCGPGQDGSRCGCVEDPALAAADVAVDAGGQAGIVPGDVEPILLDVDEADRPAVVVVRAGARSRQPRADRRPGQAGREVEPLVSPARIVGDVGDGPDLARPAARLGIGQDEDVFVVIESVGVGVTVRS